MNEQFNHENNFLEENKIQSERNQEGIPAMIKVREKKSHKGRGAILTLAVALASFGAGSLYTSYNWIEEQVKANKEAVANQHTVSQMPQNTISQTSTNKSGAGLSVAEVANIAAASVVEITTEAVSNDFFFGQYVNQGAGSGVIISSDGYIATNNHVIDGASKITVRLTNGEEYQAKLIGTDPQTDVAVIKVEDAKLQPVTYGDSDSLAVGDTAIAIGNPLGKLGGTVTNGIISALNREIQLENQKMTLLQTNAAINPGNSGGGLFNDQGQLIGLVVAKSGGSSSGTSIEGLGFAIPVNVVKEVVKSIMDVGYVQGRPVLGVSVVEINSVEKAYQYGVNQLGLYIGKLTEGTKAEKGGLKVGDCIVAVGETQVTSMADLKQILQQHKVGETVTVLVSREGKLVTLHVELSESVPETKTEEKIPTSDN